MLTYADVRRRIGAEIGASSGAHGAPDSICHGESRPPRLHGAVGGGAAGGSKNVPDDRVAARIIETVAKLSVAQQRQVLAGAKLLLAPSV